MNHTQAVVEREQCALVRAADAVCVLHVCFYTCSVEAVVGTHGVDHLQVGASVWYAVASGVAHLIFARLLSYALAFERERNLYIVATCLRLEQYLGACDVGLEVVACMLEVGAYSEIFACLRLREPILSLYVVGLLLFGMES